MVDQASYLEKLDERIEEAIFENINTAFPAKITKVSLYEKFQAVDVKPLIQRRLNDRALETAVISQVPVVFPSGGGGLLSFPLKEGDIVLVVVSQHGLGEFLSGTGEEVPSQTYDAFNKNDAIAFPCLFPWNNSLQPNPDDIELKWQDMSFKLQQDNGITLNNANSSITLEPDGRIEIVSNDGSQMFTDPGGAASIQNDNGTFALLPDGQFQFDNTTASTGVYVEYAADGEVTLTTKGGGNVDLNVDGNLDADVEGDVDITSQGNVVLAAPVGTFSITSQSSASIASDSSGTITINGVEFDTSGNISSVGTLDATGNIATEADVEASGEVTARKYSGTGVNVEIPLSTHKHFVLSAPGESEVPTIPPP